MKRNKKAVKKIEAKVEPKEEKKEHKENFKEVLADKLELFIDQFDDACMRIDVSGHKEIWPIKSERARALMVMQMMRMGIDPTTEKTAALKSYLEGKAFSLGKKHALFNRVAELGDSFWLDLANLQCGAVKISQGSWEKKSEVPTLFKRYGHQMPLAVEEGSKEAFDKYIKLMNLKDMGEKIEAQFSLQEKIQAVNPADAAERLLLHHFFPDLYGNLRSFSQQEFRCLQCKAKYRRVPLSGKCNACGGKLLLTINKGGITKYLDHAENLIARYHLPAYMKQRMELFRKDIASIFTEEPEKQRGLAEFM